jgi:hypothetical protein
MTCANPVCGAQSLYLCRGGVYSVDRLSGFVGPGGGQVLQRRAIGLCDTCTGEFAVETGRPSGSPRSAHLRAAAQSGSAESWS